MPLTLAIYSTQPSSLSKSSPSPSPSTPSPPLIFLAMLRLSKPFLWLALALLSAAAAVCGDIAGDRAECAEELVQDLSTCLQYVEGSARAPTPDCCAGLGKVRAEKPKCLCVLIKDHDSPELGVTINVSLAVGLPSVCHVSANISRCPKLLNLPPDSKEAAIFKQPSSSQGNGSSSSSSAAAGIQAGGDAPGNGSSVVHSGAGGCQAGRWVKKLGAEKVGGIWISSFMSLVSIFIAFV